jgi:Sensors of blue-light using FAD
MDLVHCIYCSASTSGTFGPSDLSALLEKCRTSNARCDVTGMLLFQNQSFFQVLEGDRSVVEALFDRLALDPRHKRVTRVILEPISERAFASWTMGYPRVSEKELAEIPGLNDFFGRSSSYLELGEGRAKALLAAFKDGKWRMSLS